MRADEMVGTDGILIVIGEYSDLQSETWPGRDRYRPPAVERDEMVGTDGVVIGLEARHLTDNNGESA